MQVIEPAAWCAQPWRNGRGVTHEVVRWPGEPFAVRISVADITGPAPFSAFAGYRRWLYLLDGGPVTLDVDRERTVLGAPGDGVAFAGDATVAAIAVARPSRDLNVMVRDTLPARVELLRGARCARAGAVAVFAIAGEVVVADAAGPRALARHACAWSIDTQIVIEAAADAIAVVVAIEDASGRP